MQFSGSHPKPESDSWGVEPRYLHFNRFSQGYFQSTLEPEKDSYIKQSNIFNGKEVFSSVYSKSMNFHTYFEIAPSVVCLFTALHLSGIYHSENRPTTVTTRQRPRR